MHRKGKKRAKRGWRHLKRPRSCRSARWLDGRLCGEEGEDMREACYAFLLPSTSFSSPYRWAELSRRSTLQRKGEGKRKWLAWWYVKLITSRSCRTCTWIKSLTSAKPCPSFIRYYISNSKGCFLSKKKPLKESFLETRGKEYLAWCKIQEKIFKDSF